VDLKLTKQRLEGRSIHSKEVFEPQLNAVEVGVGDSPGAYKALRMDDITPTPSPPHALPGSQ